MTLDEARAVALSLPGSTEAPHFERTSFFFPQWSSSNACGSIPIATPTACSSLAGVAVDLARADPEIVRDLLEESWRRRAPKRLLRELDERP